MNILFITHVLELYGANRSMLDIVNNLDRNVFNVFVIGPGKGALSRKLKEMGINYQMISMHNTVHYTESCWETLVKIEKNILAVKSIADYIRDMKIDVIHTNSSVINLGATAAWITNTRHFWHIRELDVHYGYKKDCVFWDNFLMRKSEKIICISKYVRSSVEKTYQGRNMIIYYNPIETENYIINRKEIFTSDQIIILCCGILEENKRQLEVVKALKILHKKGLVNLKLMIVGGGSCLQAKKIQKYIKENHMMEYVEMYPFCEDLSEYRKRADIAVMPSVNEALGRVTIESMLSELVLIGADSGATSELIIHGYNGLKYNAGSEYDLAEKIEYVIKHRGESESMIRNAKKSALLKFDVKKKIKKLEKLYLTKGKAREGKTHYGV